MSISTIYSIGHGNKKIDDFITELKSFSIQFLLDIRSKPFSKWNPQFNQYELKIKLEEQGIKYVFIGDKLGGLPEDRTCYDREGKVLYDVIKQKDFFRKGIEKLTSANDKKIKLAIMCSESKPEECHRSKLIGEELLFFKISIKHIVSAKKIKSQETVILELNKGLATTNLFGNSTEFTSRKSY